MVLRIYPSMITFSSIFLLVPVLGIISACIGYGIRRMIEEVLLGLRLARFIPSLPV